MPKRKPVVPGTNVALLTRTSKMPCKSWSIRALANGNCPGAVVKDSPDGRKAICAFCYAAPQMKLYVNRGKRGPAGSTRAGTYGFSSVVKAQMAREHWTTECLKTPEGQDQWVWIMTDAIRRFSRNGYFRVHDAGDMFNLAYARMWTRVMTNLPKVKFWVPTRMWNHNGNLIMMAVLQELRRQNALPNVTDRPSGLYFEDNAPVIKGLSAGTGARKVGFTCPAGQNNHRCGPCRVCWDEPETEVYYEAI